MRGLVPTIAGSVAVLALTTGCVSAYDIAIDMSAKPTMDVSAFQRVLVPGFIAGGVDDIDVDAETTRLLRSQFRSRTPLRVIDADALPMMQLAARTQGKRSEHAEEDRPRPKNDKELDDYLDIFTQSAFWKRIGEEYQEPLIVTGTVLVQRESRNGYVQNNGERFDAMGRRALTETRTWVERTAFELRATLWFIDGRTGDIIKTDTYQEELVFSAERQVPALSAYFELMDRVVPNVLRSVSTQPVRGWRVLLK